MKNCPDFVFLTATLWSTLFLSKCYLDITGLRNHADVNGSPVLFIFDRATIQTKDPSQVLETRFMLTVKSLI